MFGKRGDAFLQILNSERSLLVCNPFQPGMTLWLATTTTLICASSGVAADFRQARPGYPVGRPDSYGIKMRQVGRAAIRVKARS
jgi:hypothetical protein